MKRLLVALMVLLVPAAARASDTAERLFHEARQAVAAGDFATACPKFEESQRIEPAPGTLMNLAECEEHLGAIVRARNDFALAASGFPKDDPRRVFVLQHAAELEKRFAHLKLRLAEHAPTDAVLRRSNVLVDRSMLGVSVAVDPGDQRIVVTAPGRFDKRYTLQLGEGESTELTIDAGEPVPANIQYRTVMLGVKERTNGRRVAGIFVVGLGVAAVAAGAVAGVVAMGDTSAVHAHCDAAGQCDPQGFGAASEGKIAAPLSTACFIGGGGFVLAGTMLLWASAGRSRTTITPVVGPATAGLAISGAF
jgi:hypothetical protein